MSTSPQAEPLVLESAWSKAHQLCGGSPKKGNPSWWRNPQFRLQLVTGERTQVFITLSQQDPRFNPNAMKPNGDNPFRREATFSFSPYHLTLKPKQHHQLY